MTTYVSHIRVPAFLATTDRLLREQTFWLFMFIMLAIAVWRTGFTGDGNFYDFVAQGISGGSDSWRTSFVTTLLIDILGIGSSHGWTLALVALQIPLLLMVGFSVWTFRFNTDVRLLIALLLVSPASLMLLQRQGHYDVMTILGGVLVGLWARQWTVGLGVFAMLLGNMEQTLIALGCLAIAATSRVLLPRSPVILAWLVAATGAGLLASLLAYGNLAQSGEGSRVAWQLDVAQRSLLLHVPLVPLLIFSSLGLLWLLLPWFLEIAPTGRRRLLLSLGLFGVPTLFMFINLDGTRIFACIATPTITALIVAFCRSQQTSQSHHESLVANRRGFTKDTAFPMLGSLILAAVFIPAINVGQGSLSHPFIEIYRLLIEST